MSEPCILCDSVRTYFFHESLDKLGHREFYHCKNCDLVFVPPHMHLDFAAQRERYLIHENDPTEQGYREFLYRLLSELIPLLPPASSGLDYGAGPGPALAMMLREEGFQMNVYDPIFHPDEVVLTGTYNFITCTETLEHLHKPTRELDHINKLLEPGGWFGVMTSMLDNWSDFPEWGYHRDPTHIAFYTDTTMRWIAQQWDWQPSFPRPNVVLFHKPG